MDSLFSPENIFTTEKIFTVLELNQQAREVLRIGFPRAIWVCGEIQNLREQRGKNHMYFSLVQKDPDSDSILAQIDANLFAGVRKFVEKRIEESQGNFQIKNDIEVKFLCEVDLYAPRGKYNINIKDIDPVYTLGKVAQNRLKIIEDLKKRGLLEKNKLFTDLPVMPLRIGLITSYDSAAYHDFINELKTSGYSFRVGVCNCHMQGKLVEPDVIRALNLFNRLPVDNLDAIVITRGGGSTADLSYFDNKKIAESIAGIKFPVISAIGHQIDNTITDIVAHTICKTPTKAAQFLVEKIRAIDEHLDYLEENILKLTSDTVLGKKRELQNVSIRLESASSRFFRVHSEDLLDKKHVLTAAIGLSLAKQRDMLKNNFSSLAQASFKLFKDGQTILDHFESKLKILDPKNILQRGYSITLKNRKAIKSIDDIDEGDIINTMLCKGSVESLVKKKTSYNEKP